MRDKLKPESFPDMCRGKISLAVIRDVADMSTEKFETLRKWVRSYMKRYPVAGEADVDLRRFINEATRNVEGLDRYEDAWPAVVCFRKTLAQRKSPSRSVHDDRRSPTTSDVKDEVVEPTSVPDENVSTSPGRSTLEDDVPHMRLVLRDLTANAEDIKRVLAALFSNIDELNTLADKNGFFP